MTPRDVRRLTVVALALVVPCQIFAAIYMVESGELALGAVSLAVVGLVIVVGFWLSSRAS